MNNSKKSTISTKNRRRNLHRKNKSKIPGVDVNHLCLMRDFEIDNSNIWDADSWWDLIHKQNPLFEVSIVETLRFKRQNVEKQLIFFTRLYEMRPFLFFFKRKYLAKEGVGATLEEAIVKMKPVL